MFNSLSIWSMTTIKQGSTSARDPNTYNMSKRNVLKLRNNSFFKAKPMVKITNMHLVIKSV